MLFSLDRMASPPVSPSVRPKGSLSFTLVEHAKPDDSFRKIVLVFRRRKKEWMDCRNVWYDIKDGIVNCTESEKAFHLQRLKTATDKYHSAKSAFADALASRSVSVGQTHRNTKPPPPSIGCSSWADATDESDELRT